MLHASTKTKPTRPTRSNVRGPNEKFHNLTIADTIKQAGINVHLTMFKIELTS